VVVLGLGAIGDMACRVARHRGAELVVAVDRVPERIARARARGVVVLDWDDHAGGDGDLRSAVLELTAGRGADAAIDAVGMEAHGSPLAHLAHRITGWMPDRVAERLMKRVGTDRLAALLAAIDVVRRGGTVSVIGVYGGMTDPLPMLTLFDRQIQLRMGQANVRRWVDDIVPLLVDDDPLGVDDFATHRLPLEDAPEAYSTFQRKGDGMVKTIFQP
jgi:threonine dehydrogenase-like Zn-dependent dehydrogenase